MSCCQPEGLTALYDDSEERDRMKRRENILDLLVVMNEGVMKSSLQKDASLRCHSKFIR